MERINSISSGAVYPLEDVRILLASVATTDAPMRLKFITLKFVAK